MKTKDEWKKEILNALKAEPLPTRKIARKINCNITKVYELLYDLEKHGIVERFKNSEDVWVWKLKNLKNKK